MCHYASRINIFSTEKSVSFSHYFSKTVPRAPTNLSNSETWVHAHVHLPQKSVRKNGSWARVDDRRQRLQGEGVRGADRVFACIGPALEIFSRYSKVETPEGQDVELAQYLEKVWLCFGVQN